MSERNYPTEGLNMLYRDPIVRWGCSYSEIMRSVTRGALASLVLVFIIMIALPLSGMIKFGVALVIFIISTLGIARFLCFKIARSRSNKPPHYDKHTMFIKRGVFAKPGQNYQRERNK